MVKLYSQDIREDMGSQTPMSNDRSRTYWTPTMESYFVELMVDHVHREHRIGHTFNKQAWTDMLTVFNARFGSQYDKDVLKSRYTNLWKQFNDIKNLLGESGFSWDETRQMVVADDCVWDAYVKVHPDARSYKTKTVLNFNDLCFIYSYATADGRYSRSSHDIDIDDEVPAVTWGDGMPSLTPCERSRTDWTPAMDQYFIELMLDQLGRGNKIDNIFNKQAWTDMLTMFNAKFGSQHGKRVLRHRYKKFSKYYSDVTILLEQNGFSWNETQQMIVASDDVWDAYIKAHPHARSYRSKTLPNYKDLVLIYGDSISDGVHSHLHIGDDVLGIKAGEGKEGQNPSGSERSRTYWTPPMDRYLIDLLLDQVHRGNKLGQTFISQAWINMVTSFNVRFNSHHDKDVLKNRYKHLKRQFNEIKILLEQSGFTWDETRDMVTAEDKVWDAYIKAHPDARSYRVKTVPSFHKLCVIYGQENYDGRYSRLARNVGSLSEIPVLMTGEEKDDQSPNIMEMHWTPQMDHFFVDLMLKKVQGGNKVDPTFSDPSWANLISLFNDKFGILYDKQILENRYKCLMKQYTDISNLLDRDGFVWNETQQIVTANDDVWEAYIKECPEAILYRNKILENYNDMCIIWRNGNSNERTSCMGLDTEIYQSALEVKTDGVQSSAKDIEKSYQSKKRQSSTPLSSSSYNKVCKTSDGMKEVLNKMAGAVTTLAAKNGTKNYSSLENAIDALQAIPDIDDELLLDACDLLEEERKAKTFLALDGSLRKKWLLRKLRPQ